MTDKVVKSVGRVFEILELFNRERRALSGIEIARLLGYPHTSTLALLKSMQVMGYMLHDRKTWTFMPSQNIPMISEWIIDSLEPETAIINVLKALHKATGETINLSRQSAEFIRIVYGIESTYELAIKVRQGATVPINATHTGMVALACLPNHEIERTIGLLQLGNYPQSKNIALGHVLERVETIRQQRYAPGYDIYVKGIGAVCVAVKSVETGKPFIIGVVGPSDRLRESEQKIIETAKIAVAANNVELAYPEH